MTHERFPRYAARGGEQVLRAPFLHERARMRNFVLAADRDRLQRLCDAHFNGPSSGSTDYRPLSDAVMLSFTTIPWLASMHPDDREVGWGEEIDVAFWVPLVSTFQGAPRVAWFIPYIFVDNPYAMAAGREHYGFPKTVGAFGIPDDPRSPDPYTVDAMALRTRSPATKAACQRLFEVARTGPAPDGAEALAESLAALRAYLPLVTGDVAPADALRLGVDHCENLFFRREVMAVFLRQLRDVADPGRAAFQEIVEAPARVVRYRDAGAIPGGFELRCPPCASHPIADDLGLRTDGHPVRAAFWTEFDFVMDTGRVVWSSGAGVPADAPPPARRAVREPLARRLVAAVMQRLA